MKNIKNRISEFIEDATSECVRSAVERDRQARRDALDRQREAYWEGRDYGYNLGRQERQERVFMWGVVFGAFAVAALNWLRGWVW
jgi:hypothetical protein